MPLCVLVMGVDGGVDDGVGGGGGWGWGGGELVFQNPIRFDQILIVRNTHLDCRGSVA